MDSKLSGDVLQGKERFELMSCMLTNAGCIPVSYQYFVAMGTISSSTCLDNFLQANEPIQRL